MATLDLLSDGRLEMGIGAGWTTSDYDQSGLTLDQAGIRVDPLTEAVTVLQDLFDGLEVTYQGDQYSFEHMRSVPLRTGRRPRLLIGGGGRRALCPSMTPL
jgi:alkanesulfonate monooxygenase SsuD/methylene tetrahydromethanopterin reductase-like flavin-dependent oxidoreductase (luciferase family)